MFAGLGNNPPASSPYWREIWIISLAVGSARREKTWKNYCRRFNKVYDHFWKWK